MEVGEVKNTSSSSGGGSGVSSGGVLRPIIIVSGGNKGGSHTGASHGSGGSFAIKGLRTDSPIAFEVRKESKFRSTTSFEINENVHALSLASFADVDVHDQQPLVLSGLKTFVLGMNAKLRGKTMTINTVSGKIGGGSVVHSDSWGVGSVAFHVAKTLMIEASARISADTGGSVNVSTGMLTMEASARISADAGGSVRMVATRLDASRTAILSGSDISIAVASGTVEPILRIQDGGNLASRARMHPARPWI